MEIWESTEFEVLLERRSSFLTANQCRGEWKAAFTDAAVDLPTPYVLFGTDEERVVAIGFPILVSPEWEALIRRLSQLVHGEVAYRTAQARSLPYEKPALVEQRRRLAGGLSGIFENAMIHDHGRKFRIILWLALMRECASAVTTALDAKRDEVAGLTTEALEEIRFSAGERVAEVIIRAEAAAVRRVRKGEYGVKAARPTDLGAVVRDDVLPLVHRGDGGAFAALDSYLAGRRRLDTHRFGKSLLAATEQLARLRVRDTNFATALGFAEPELGHLTSRRLLFQPRVVALLKGWKGTETVAVSAELADLLDHLAGVLTRFEVLSSLASITIPVSAGDAGPVARVGGRFIALAPTTRALDFTRPGVADSAVQRFGLLYDLVEFTQLFEGLRRQGRKNEEEGLRLLRRFNDEIGQIRKRHRIRFEKFLGDGAFYSGRSARAMLVAAAELRLLYERLRRQGFPFDRGMRLAINVGTYHLVPLFEGPDGRPHFEFLGHSLVELARLTSGKTTYEVDDITDFLIASGYDLNTVLEFLEPVRKAPRHPEHVRERPYAAFIAENSELVNLGGVVTEEFLVALAAEWPEAPLVRGTMYGISWLLVPLEPANPHCAWVGLRLLGSARLKGIQPGPLAEVVVVEHPPDGSEPLAEGVGMVEGLHRLSRGTGDGDDGDLLPASVAELGEEKICVVSFNEGVASRVWLIGIFDEELVALAHAYRVPLEISGPSEDEPVEAWLFRRRGELTTLYQGLRRSSTGATIPFDQLRSRDGFFASLLAAPHRSPL